MNEDDHKGIASILNLPRRSPVKTLKVAPQEFPSLSLSDAVMRLKPLELPKSEPEPKDEFGYTKKQNREIENYITRPKILSNNINRLKKFGQEESSVPVKKKIGAVDYVDKIVDMYEGDNINDVKYSGTRSDNPHWMKDLEKEKSKRFVNKTLNKFENRTANQSVVTFDPTTQLFTDDTRNIAFKSYNDAKRWNDKVNQEPTATPQQVNDLKARLDNSRAFGSDPDKKEMRKKNNSLNQPNKNRRLI